MDTYIQATQIFGYLLLLVAFTIGAGLLSYEVRFGALMRQLEADLKAGRLHG